MKSIGSLSSLGSALHDAFDQYGLKSKIREREIFLHWEEIVGSAIAKQSEPVRVKSGRLLIRVSNAVWRQELLQMRTELIRKINHHLGVDIVKEIIFR